MGQLFSKQTQHDESAGDAETNLYRSRSSRSFADITVSKVRRNLQRVHRYFTRKPRRLENIELSPMATSQENLRADSFKLEEALDAQSLEDKHEPQAIDNQSSLKLYPHLSTAQTKIEPPEHAHEEIELETVKKPNCLDFPFLEDPCTVKWISQNRIVFLMRGLPGSGKSFLMNAIIEVYNASKPVICSADQYFYDENGIYRWDALRLKDAHEFCQTTFKNALKEGKKMVIVDNTNVTAWEMRQYFIPASKASYTYRVIVVEPKTPWRFDPVQLSLKNSHDVSSEVLEKKVKSYVQAVPLYFGWFLNPSDSKTMLDKAMDLFKQLYNCDEFRQSFAKFSSMLNLPSALSYYSREMMSAGDHSILHCTARFFGNPKAVDKEAMKEYMTKPQVQNSIGHVQKLKIIGYYLTNETFGCRIQLDPDQLEIFGVKEKGSKAKQYGKPQKVFPIEDEFKDESVTIEKVPQDSIHDRFRPISGKGQRAHLTLFTARGARAVNAGIDLLNIVQAEKEEAKHEMVIPETQDVVRLYENNLWVVYPEHALYVDSLFTGFY